MNNQIKKCQQNISEFLTKHFPFITSKYQDKSNKQAYKELFYVLVLLFLLLLVSLIWYSSIGLKEVIELYIKIVGGVAVLGAAYFAWKRLEVNQEGQITERFTRAIDQLGSEKLEVRLGGIYALERISKDSEKDYWPIMEVLTAYIRENATNSDEEPTTDVQAIMTVLGRRKIKTFPENQCLNLNGVRLSGINLSSANLAGSHFIGASLRNANFVFANFLGASLDNADLRGAVFAGARLEATFIMGARLEGADLENSIEPNKKQLEFTIIDRETKLPDYLMDDTAWYEEQIKRSEEWLTENPQKEL